MIWFSFRIDNPWFKDKNKRQIDYFCIEKMVTKHKFIETQLSRFPIGTIFDITIDTRWRGQSHAGPNIDITLFGFGFILAFRDNRHWNYDEGRWMTDYEMEHEFDE